MFEPLFELQLFEVKKLSTKYWTSANSGMAEGGACKEMRFPPGFKPDRRRHSVDTVDRFIPRRSVVRPGADPNAGADPDISGPGGRGEQGTRPLGQNFFIFIQFSEKNGQIGCLTPQELAPVWEILDLLLSGFLKGKVVGLYVRESQPFIYFFFF